MQPGLALNLMLMPMVLTLALELKLGMHWEVELLLWGMRLISNAPHLRLLPLRNRLPWPPSNLPSTLLLMKSVHLEVWQRLPLQLK